MTFTWKETFAPADEPPRELTCKLLVEMVGDGERHVREATELDLRTGFRLYLSAKGIRWPF